MKKILNATVKDNQTKGGISFQVSRGHASVHLTIDTYKTDGEPSSIEIYLQPDDADTLGNALRKASQEVLSKSAIE